MLGQVISCFAGLGCGELALKNCGIETIQMYAYEIDKYAEAVNRYHNPYTVFLGDIKGWKDDTDIIGDGIDLIMGGSPCQDLSIAGKRAGLDGARSSLVYVFAEMVKHYKPKYFFLENVGSMTQENKKEISKLMGIEPLEISSADVSAQHRTRLYWTNIPYTKQDFQKLSIKDILEEKPDNVLYYDKSRITLTNTSKNRPKTLLTRKIGDIDSRSSQSYRVYDISGKLPALDTRGDRIKILMDNGNARSLSVTEVERAFTIPDGYTARGVYGNGAFVNISKTQRHRMLGNGWVVKVIEQFFQNIEE